MASGKVRVKGLTPGPKGSKVTIDYQGMQTTSFALAAIVNEKIPKDLKTTHVRMSGVIGNRARAYFESSVRRPQESGERPEHGRQTGHFTFGIRGGGTFVGVVIDEPSKGIYGFGYPNVPRADSRTHFVWRALEWGLRPHPKAIQNEWSPRGQHLFPAKFTFQPFTGPGGVFQGRAGPARRTGILVTPQGKSLGPVKAPGFEPKLFITRAFQDTIEVQQREYRLILGSAFAKFK